MSLLPDFDRIEQQLAAIKIGVADAIKKSCTIVNGLDDRFQGVTVEVEEDETRDSQVTTEYLADITFNIDGKEFSMGDEDIPLVEEAMLAANELEDSIIGLGHFLGVGKHTFLP